MLVLFSPLAIDIYPLQLQPQISTAFHVEHALAQDNDYLAFIRHGRRAIICRPLADKLGIVEPLHWEVLVSMH